MDLVLLLCLCIHQDSLLQAASAAAAASGGSASASAASGMPEGKIELLPSIVEHRTQW